MYNLPKLLPVQHVSKDGYHDIILKNILPPTSFSDEDCFGMRRTWNQEMTLIPNDFHSYKQYLLEGDKNNHGIVDLQNPSKNKADFKNMHSSAEYDKRCNIMHDNYVADSAYNMGNIRVQSFLPVQMLHVVNRNDIKSVKVKTGSSRKLDEIMSVKKVQDSIEHLVPGVNYCKLQECHCSVEDEVTTYSNKDNSSTFAHHYMEENEQFWNLLSTLPTRLT